jgi:hypothetical protein
MSAAGGRQYDLLVLLRCSISYVFDMNQTRTATAVSTTTPAPLRELRDGNTHFFVAMVAEKTWA